MKCPCCSADMGEPRVFYWDRKLYYAGKTFGVEPSVARLFIELLDNPVTITTGTGLTTLSKLRAFLRDSQLGLHIPRNNRSHYRMVSYRV